MTVFLLMTNKAWQNMFLQQKECYQSQWGNGVLFSHYFKISKLCQGMLFYFRVAINKDHPFPDESESNIGLIPVKSEQNAKIDSC